MLAARARRHEQYKWYIFQFFTTSDSTLPLLSLIQQMASNLSFFTFHSIPCPLESFLLGRYLLRSPYVIT
jgi:hypothetical protein